MGFTATSVHHLPHHTDCLIIGVFEGCELCPLGQDLDKTSQGTLSNFLALGDFTGKIDEAVLFHRPHNIGATRLLLVGCGKKHTLTDQQFYKILSAIAQQIKTTKIKHATYALPELAIKNHKLTWQFKQAVLVLRGALYNFTQLKSSKDNPGSTLAELIFYASAGNLTALNQALHTGLVVANNVSLARDLGNMPPNICTPAYLAAQAQLAANTLSNLQVEILEEAHLQELKMGALLAVTQGSQHPAKFVILRYQGAVQKDAKPTVLLGKGITFDTGGINLKPSANIVGMKYDMCGAASVLAVLRTAAELKLSINLIGIMVCVENMIGSHAYRPDDVITSMSGQTIEINNTDAEGRLILCDALTYCERFQPEVVIDIATLTGAIVVALGTQASGLFSNDATLADALLQAGQESGDRAWQLPLWEEYQPQLDSTVADMVNSATSGGNSITAACFLSRFARNYAWAHLDVAGTAFQTGTKACATGRPVPLLVEYLLGKCSH